MAQFDYDLFVIGAGSGGVRAARIAAGYGARVAIAEESRVGGTCVIRGCVPKKLLSYAAHFHEDFEDARNYGWTVGEAKFDWPTLIANKDKEIDRLNGIYKKLLSGSKVDLLETRGVLVDPHTVELAGKRVTAKHILIAVGGWPERPDIPGIEHSITSNEAFHLPALPREIVVVGGGYIAVEFAGIFNGLGAKVTQLYRGEQILRMLRRKIARGKLAAQPHVHDLKAEPGQGIDQALPAPLRQHRHQRGLGQGIQRPRHHLFLKAFDVHLDQRRRPGAHDIVQPSQGNLPNARPSHRDHTVSRLQTGREVHLPRLGSQGASLDPHPALDPVHRHVARQGRQRVGIGLGADRLRPADLGRQHRVAADIGAHVDEQLARPQQVQDKRHLGKFVQAAIEVARRPFHAAPRRKARPADPRLDQFIP